jgi:hypothetical protein
MSGKTKVVVEGGGDNLYIVSEYSGTFYVYKGGQGFLGLGKDSIGEASSLDKALVLIKAYTGKPIKKISDM